jgi:hypothetical protein
MTLLLAALWTKSLVWLWSSYKLHCGACAGIGVACNQSARQCDDASQSPKHSDTRLVNSIHLHILLLGLVLRVIMTGYILERSSTLDSSPVVYMRSTKYRSCDVHCDQHIIAIVCNYVFVFFSWLPGYTPMFICREASGARRYLVIM